MNERLRFDFAVFYNCIIKNHTILKQNQAINMLLTGKDNDYSDSNCSNYGTGNRRIPVLCANYIQDPDKEAEILQNINSLRLHYSDCLTVFFDLVDSGYIEFDMQNESFLNRPRTDDEHLFFIAKLLRYSTYCPASKINKLSKEQIQLLQNGRKKETENILEEQMPTTCNTFADNYHKTLFWSASADNSLEKLYVFNTYRFLQHTTEYDDLELLVKSFINGELINYLRRSKGIQQFVPIHILLITAFPGCGKTSLLSKLAHEYHNITNIHFLNMVELKNSVVTLDTIAEKLSVSKQQLRNSLLILDSLDEAIKHTENCDEALMNLADEFEDFGIKSVITCRSNLLTSNTLRSCFEIELQGFNSTKAIEWLNRYHDVNPDFPIEQWEFTVSHLDSTLSKVLLIPLILYICVVREIDIKIVKDIGQLYDILFDPVKGQVALPIHRSQPNYKTTEWFLLRKNIADIAVIMHQKGYINKTDIIDDDMLKLKKYFGLDFYVDVSSDQYRFVHASMWQFFVAERIYSLLRELKSADDIQMFLDNMLEIVVPQTTLDNLILDFIKYFIDRDGWKPADASLYKHILFHLSDYNITQKGNILTIISCLWRDLFKIFTHIFKHYYPNMRNTFFEDSISEKSSDILIRCSNLTEESPIVNVNGYRLKQIELNGINFTKSIMRYCSLRSSTFHNANFKEASLVGIYADKCNMTGSNFSKATMHNAFLNDSILVACNFRNAKLNGANFENANLSYADLRNAILNKTIFNNAILNNCKISIQHLDTFNLELISANSIAVYDEENNIMTMEQLYEYYYNKHPVAMAFRQYSKTIGQTETL